MDEEYKKLRLMTLDLIRRDWGPRCEVKDVEDFPELLGKTEFSEGRCASCLVYERFDKFWELFDYGDINDE